MVTDIVLDVFEGIIRGIMGLMPELCNIDQQCEAGVGWVRVNQMAGGNIVILIADIYAYANYWLPIDSFFLMLSIMIGVYGILALIRVIWRLIPGIG